MKNTLKLEIKRPGYETEHHEVSFGTYPTGSEKGNKIIIEDKVVEKRHAILIFGKDGFRVEDLNSRSGTFIDGNQVEGHASFQAGQEIRIGNCRLIIRDDSGSQADLPVQHEICDTSHASKPESGRRKSKSLRSIDKSEESASQTHSAEPSSMREQKATIKKQIHTELLNRLDMKRLTAAQVKEKELHERTQKTLKQIVNDIRKRLPSWIDPDTLIKEIYDEAVALGPLEDLLADPEITEIMVNRHDQIYVEKNGKLILSDRVFMDDGSVMAIMERIVSPIGRRIDESQPYVDARLKDGSRVNAIIPPLALNGPCLTIRKFSKDVLTIEHLIKLGTLTSRIADFLHLCVLLRKNIIVAGGTGSGKTTFLNVMSSFLPEDERIVTIEDSAELRLAQAHIVRLESRPPNIEGRGSVAIRDLLRNSLRMRPDRLIIGECRGGEALDMLQAMNTGHDGSMTTVHANSPRDVISRLETMTLMSGVELPSRAIREQIAAAIHLIIQTARFSDGSRKVTYITEISGLEGDRITMQDIFVFNQTGLESNGKVAGYFCATGSVPTFTEEIKTQGLSLDMKIFDPRQWKQ